MTRIFLLYATSTEDLACASCIRQDLNVRGYTVYDEVQTFDGDKRLYQNSPQNALVGSAAVILLWSSNAAHNERIWNAVRFAQQLKRPVLPVTLDNTSFPETLKGAPSTRAIPPYDTTASLLVSLLPPPQSNDSLLTIYAQAVDISPEKRKRAIENAANLLKNGQHAQQGDAVIALLECLAQYDTITSVQDKAHEILKALQSGSPLQTPFTMAHPSQDPFFDAACPKGHVSQFDKRIECKKTEIYRGLHVLTCKTCDQDFGFSLNCGGYR